TRLYSNRVSELLLWRKAYARRKADHALLDKLDRGRKPLLDDLTLTTGVLLWSGFNSQARNVTALLPARIGSPRQKEGKLPNDQSSVVGLHKD
ncbi:hypothetical protein A2U01_0073871, partial [Trifolium medium]|nr:hypothetical protein [Trifolium medium]